MILLSFDVESTGLDFVKDRVIEVGAVLWSTSQHKTLESQGFLVKPDVPVSAEITKITGITQAAVDKFGYESASALETVMDLMSCADAIIGHNVKRFDQKMLAHWAIREGISDLPQMLWIDTMTDLPDTFATKLGYMASDAGFVNLFPHSALTDCLTVLKLVEKYDIDKVVERAQSPMVVVQAHQARHENELAKKAKFRWYPAKTMWWKFVKEIDLEEFGKTLPFDYSVHRENIEEFQDL